MFDQIGRLTRTHGARSVRRVRVRIGEFAGVDPALFQTAYEACRVDTMCAEAVLQIQEVPASDDLILDEVDLEVA